MVFQTFIFSNKKKTRNTLQAECRIRNSTEFVDRSSFKQFFNLLVENTLITMSTKNVMKTVNWNADKLGKQIIVDRHYFQEEFDQFCRKQSTEDQENEEQTQVLIVEDLIQ